MTREKKEERQIEEERNFKRAKRLQIAIASFVVASILSVSAVIGLGVFVIQREQATSAFLEAQVEQNEAAIASLKITRVVQCAQQENLKARVAETEARIARIEKYIAQVENGKRNPVPGVTIRELEAQLVVDRTLLKNQKITVKVYNLLKCKKVANG